VAGGVRLSDTAAKCHPERRAKVRERVTLRPICNQCYKKWHYFENRMRYKAKQAEWYSLNAEKKKAYVVRWKLSNRERVRRWERDDYYRRKINGIRIRKAA
jgi:hypothetical protein